MYDFTSEKAIAIAAEQALAFERHVSRVDTIFATEMTPEERAALLQTASPDLSAAAATTLAGLDGDGWSAVRAESARVLDAVLRTELLDTEVAATKTRLTSLMAGGLDASERMLAAELIRELVVPNSSFSEELTAQEQDRVEAAVEPIVVKIARNEVVVRNGTLLTAADIEKIDALGLGIDRLQRDRVRRLVRARRSCSSGCCSPGSGGSGRRSGTATTSLFLIGMLVAGATLALKITAGRSILPVLPADRGHRDAAWRSCWMPRWPRSSSRSSRSSAGAVNGSSLEFAAYTFLGGVAGIIAVRQAATGSRSSSRPRSRSSSSRRSVVTVFSLLGDRDVHGPRRAVVRVRRECGRVRRGRGRPVRGPRAPCSGS